MYIVQEHCTVNYSQYSGAFWFTETGANFSSNSQQKIYHFLQIGRVIFSITSLVTLVTFLFNLKLNKKYFS